MSIINLVDFHSKDFNDISVAIDSLDDIFSDFDPRPLHHRALSEDFLQEIQKFYREYPSGKIVVNFLAPVSVKNRLQNNNMEKAILNHLHHEFRRRALSNTKVIRAIQRRGYLYLTLGMLFLLIMVYIGYNKLIDSLTLEILGVVVTPIGWFGVWEGFSKLVDIPIRLKEETVMYEKLSRAQYMFKYLGDPERPATVTL